MTTDNNKNTKAKDKRKRSPNYPYYSLKDCVGFLNKFIKNNKGGFVEAHMEFAIKYMGYSTGSNRAISAISSMLGYGLFKSRGSGKNRYFWPSELAKQIYKSPDDSNQAIALRQEAALNEPETGHVLSNWKDNLPGRGTLEKWLLADRNYSQRGAKRFSYVIEETYEFAQLSQLDNIDTSLEFQDDKVIDEKPPVSTPKPSNEEINDKTSTGFTDYPIPVEGGRRHVILRVPADLTEQDFDYIIQWIDLIKKGLVIRD